MGKILSVEIDNCNIKLLEGSIKDTSLTIYKSAFLDTEVGSIDDGKITNIDSVADIIQRALKENEIKTKKAIFSINTNSIITRIIELPLLKSNAETMSMIRNELEQLISIDLSQYKLVYKLTETFTSEEGQRGKYIINGLPISIYNQYIQLSDVLKLDMVSLDLSFNFLDKIAESKLLINKKAFEKNSTSAFIDFGYDTICFSALNNGKSDFTKIISNGMKDMVKNYATVYNLDYQEALQEISKLSLLEKYEDIEYLSKINIVEDVINGWIDELNRYLRYYNSNNKNKSIKKIYIYGAYVNIDGIEQYLSSHLNNEVEIIKEISTLNANYVKDFDTKVYFNALLSLYAHRRDINFLTDKKKEHNIRFNVGIIVMAVSFIIALILFSNLYIYMSKQYILENEISQMNKFIGSEENIKLNNEVEILMNKVYLLEKYKVEVDKVEKTIINEDAVTSIMFEEVAKALPLDSKVNSMAIDESTIQLQCTSNSKLEIAQFEKNLRNIEFIDSVYIPAVVEVAKDNFIVFTYSVACEIKDVTQDEAQ